MNRKMRMADQSIEGILSRQGDEYLLGGQRLKLDEYLGQEINIIIQKVVVLPPLEPDAWMNCGDG